MKRRVLAAILPLLGLAAIVAGLALMAFSVPPSASFGWFAYAPLSGTVFSPEGALVIGWGAVAGAVLAALGLAALAFTAGYALRARRPR